MILFLAEQQQRNFSMEERQLILLQDEIGAIRRCKAGETCTCTDELNYFPTCLMYDVIDSVLDLGVRNVSENFINIVLSYDCDETNPNKQMAYLNKIETTEVIC